MGGRNGTRSIDAPRGISVPFVIELRQLDILETVLVDGVEAGANHVDGVEFDVGTKKELRTQARTAAGIRLGPVVHIKDVDSDRVQNSHRGHGQPGGGGEGDLAPGKP